VERLDPVNYEMELAGSGQDPRGGGGATMKMSGKLKPIPDGTDVTGTIESTITGRLAQFGARMMDDVSNHLFNQFTKAFQSKLAESVPEAKQAETMPPDVATPSGTAATPEPAATVKPAESTVEPLHALPLLWSVIKGFFSRLFGSAS